ncbi:MAG: acetoacetate decarboxylase family protein [bacterium]
MNTLNPFSAINLHGDGVFRGVTLAAPIESVESLLPSGLALGDQTVTPKGTHPVIVSFNDLSRAVMSVPTLLPVLNYHEYTLGIPYSYVSRGGMNRNSPGPYYYMPRLYLNSVLAVLGGIGFWGFLKRLASFKVDEEQFIISTETDELLTSLTWKPAGEHRPVGEYAFFEPIRQMLDQPLISQLPPLDGFPFVVSDFDKRWDVATVRPLETTVEIDAAFVPQFRSSVRAQLNGKTLRETARGIDKSPLGSYELVAPWRLGMPYVPLMRAWE